MVDANLTRVAKVDKHCRKTRMIVDGDFFVCTIVRADDRDRTVVEHEAVVFWKGRKRVLGSSRDGPQGDGEEQREQPVAKAIFPQRLEPQVTQVPVGSIVLSAWQDATLPAFGFLPPKGVSCGGPRGPRVSASHEVGISVPFLMLRTRGWGTGLCLAGS